MATARLRRTFHDPVEDDDSIDVNDSTCHLDEGGTSKQSVGVLLPVG